MTLNEAYEKVAEEISNYDSTENGINFNILAMHESATKLFQATINKKDADLICTRAANALISVFSIMRTLGINNPEKCLQDRLNELKKE
ncbi:MAG: hypothetical protein WC457_03255 [Patescibacteria group bacterium]